jgi:saccharopine dehydrogenase-like NADP-dependent oxidoreductase
MANILLLGAGRSSTSLIKYLSDNSDAEGWKITVGDVSEEAAIKKTADCKNMNAILFDVKDETQRFTEIRKCDLVISMLPPDLHYLVAEDCVAFQKNMVTASYVSEKVLALDKAAKEAGIILLNEMGLDPGIDHLSAMKIIEEIKAKGGIMHAFKSYTGGLVAHEYSDNPWGYKFTWNPRNVILAGQGTAKYIEENEYRYIPYNRLFEQIDLIAIEGYGQFEGYANRDSLQYRKHYGLEQVPTMLRGTLRNPGFCKAWNAIVKLGLTDDTYIIEDSEHLSYAELLKAYLPPIAKGETLESTFAKFSNEFVNSEVMSKIKWLGLFSDEIIGLPKATPAFILQALLEKKWLLKEGDKDMIVMHHSFDYELNGKRKKLDSSLIVIGDDAHYTAMAKTVGLPLGIAAKLILNNKIVEKGVQIPVIKSIYEPVLEELKTFGISFIEKEE